jgi:hypothetical protein
MPTAFVVRERVPSFRKVFLGAPELPCPEGCLYALQRQRLVDAATAEGTDTLFDLQERGIPLPAPPRRRDRDHAVFERPSAGAGPES